MRFQMGSLAFLLALFVCSPVAASTMPPLNAADFAATASTYKDWVTRSASSSSFPGVITGGYRPFTSESVGYGILFSAGIINACQSSSNSEVCQPGLLSLAKNTLASNITFLKGHMLDSATGLARWSADDAGRADGGSATDGDFFIAQGLLLAQKNHIDTQGMSATNYMQSILKNDFYRLNNSGHPLLLPTTGSGQPEASYPLCGNKHICIEPSKAILPFMETFKRQGGVSKEDLQLSIDSTIAFMQDEQQKVHALDLSNPDNYLLVGGDEGGANWNYVTVDEPFAHLPPNQGNYRFSTDTGRIPALLGGYLQVATDHQSASYKTAVAVLQKLMRTYSVVYNSVAEKNRYYPQSVGLMIDAGGAVSPLGGGYDVFNVSSNLAGLYGLQLVGSGVLSGDADIQASIKFYGCYMRRPNLVNDDAYYKQYCANINHSNDYYMMAFQLFSELLSEGAFNAASSS